MQHVKTLISKRLKDAEEIGSLIHVWPPMLPHIQSTTSHHCVTPYARFLRLQHASYHATRSLCDPSSWSDEKQTDLHTTTNQSSNNKSHHKSSCTQSPIVVYSVPNKLNWTNFGLLISLVGLFGFIAFTILQAALETTEKMQTQNQQKNAKKQRFEVIKCTDVSFDDVKGNEEAKEELTDVIEYLKYPEKFKERNITIPKGVLLTGPAGTGKTMLARALAGEANVSFIATSGAEFDEVYIGLGARRIRKLFKLAKENAPCVVFIDEIDVVGAKRTTSLNDSHSRLSINQLLVEMDGFKSLKGVVVVGATNLPDILDPALIRPGRFDRKVCMELPDIKARTEIFNHYLANKCVSTDVCTDVLARSTSGFSGADMETIVNWAAILASKQDSECVTMKMLEDAMLNVAMGRERRSLVLTEAMRKLTAYHESGHALVALKTDGAPDIRRATLIPRGESLGMVNFMERDDAALTTKKQLLARIDTALGGRAAEEVVFGEDYVTQGAASDLKLANQIARSMVTQYGMVHNFGYFYLPNNGEHSQATLMGAEQGTDEILSQSYKRVKNILVKHKKELDLLANALLKYESLTMEEMNRAIQGDLLVEKQAELEEAALARKKCQEIALIARQERAKKLIQAPVVEEDPVKDGEEEENNVQLVPSIDLDDATMSIFQY